MSPTNDADEPEVNATLGRGRRGRWIETVVVALVGVALLYWPNVWKSGATRDSSTTVSSTRIFLAFIGSSCAAVFMVLQVTARRGETYAVLGLKRPRVVQLLGDALLLAFFLALSMVVVSIPADSEMTFSRVIDIRPPARDVPELLLACVAIAVRAFGEELFMRGYLVSRLESLLHSRVMSVIATSLLFAGIHAFQGVWPVIHALLFGVLFASAFLAMRNVWPLALAHALWNLLPYLVPSMV